MNLGNVEWFLSLHMKTNPVGGWTNPSESISQIRSFPQVGMNITKIWNHHPVKNSCVWMLKHFFGGRIPDSRWGHWLSHKPKLRINQLVLCICAPVMCHVLCVSSLPSGKLTDRNHIYFLPSENHGTRPNPPKYWLPMLGNSPWKIGEPRKRPLLLSIILVG